MSWLGHLIEEFIRFDNQPRRDLLARLKEPFPFACSAAKCSLAALTLKRKLWRDEGGAPALQPRLIRATLFRKAHSLRDRQQALDRVAAEFNVTAQDLMRTLFIDLPNEKLVIARSIKELNPSELALEANLLLIKALLARSRHITLDIFGQCRPVIRQAKLRGLICVIERKDNSEGLRLTISGPFSLFRHTLIYGRHLGELLPFLQGCNKFDLQAICVIKNREGILHLSSGVPIAPYAAAKKFDSQLERRFARDFMKLATNWDLIREPEPLPAGNQWFFPDFEARDRKNPLQRWFIELVGYWRPEYLRDKYEKLQAAKISNFILCIDKKNLCGPRENWQIPGSNLIEFSKSVDVTKVLAVMTKLESKGSQSIVD